MGKNVKMAELPTHQAEQCLNELASCDKPWFAPERFEIIKRHMEAFAQRDQVIAAKNAELESERSANAILTEEVLAIEAELTKVQEEILGLRIERATRLADSERVIDWIRNGTKPAVTSFTEGAERQIAYAVEDDRLRPSRANQQTAKGKTE